MNSRETGRQPVRVVMAESILKRNEDAAARIRKLLQETNTACVNLISSPGSGKTSILEKTIPMIAGRWSVGIIEGDIYTSRDADRIADKGVPVVQINTKGACHLDAALVAYALEELAREKSLHDLDIVFVENVGNLVCPAEFDLGEDCKVVVLSTAEGSDKPLKYPLVFRESKAVLINKIDLLEHTDFDLEGIKEELRGLNPGLAFLPVSAKTGEGLEAWCEWLSAVIAERVRR